MHFPGVLLLAECAEELLDLQQQSVVLRAPCSPGSCGASAESSAEPSVSGVALLWSQVQPARPPAPQSAALPRVPRLGSGFRSVPGVWKCAVLSVFLWTSCSPAGSAKIHGQNLKTFCSRKVTGLPPPSNRKHVQNIRDWGPCRSPRCPKPSPCRRSPRGHAATSWGVCGHHDRVGGAREAACPPPQYPGCPSKSDLPQSPPG